MDSITIKFKDKEQLEYIAKFVNSIADIYKCSSVASINELAGRLAGMVVAANDMPDVDLSFQLSQGSSLCSKQYDCLYLMCKVLNDIGADEVNAGIDIYNTLKKYYTKSDVPRFLDMLKANGVPAEHCVGLFSSWCSCEGTAALAEKCLMIQAKYNLIITNVYEWVCANDPYPDTDWTEEVTKYKEVIND